MRKFFLLVLFLNVLCAQAQVTSSLRMPADLVIHSRELQSVLKFTEAHLQSNAEWTWPEMRFSNPYKTDWSQVQAVGPIDLRFDTTNLAQGVLEFELMWKSPLIQIGRFHLNDKVVIQSGSATIISHIEGQCEFMQFKIPDGEWRVKGRMRLSSAFEPSLEELDFASNQNAEAKIDMGKCDGQRIVLETLHDTLKKFASQPEWAEQVLSAALQSLVKSAFQDLESELLKPRLIPSFVNNLELLWQPQGLARLSSGAWRVQGELKAHSQHSANLSAINEVLNAPLDQTLMESLAGSSFVLPKESMTAILKFAAGRGHGHHRSTSADWPQIKDLLQNRLFQFFLWPDLLNFKRNTSFYFDVTTATNPKFSELQSHARGLTFGFATPLKTLQWAPHQGEFVPYFEFNARAEGAMDLRVENETLEMNVRTKALDVKAQARAEFQAKRAVHPRISTAIMGAAIQQAVVGQTYRIKLPQWKLNEHLHLGVEALRVQQDALLLPLQIRSSK